jgi:cation transport ATPase
MTRVADLIPVLQIAIAPVILISGVGLLVLSMTNRLARIVDRTRQLWREARVTESTVERENLYAQLRLLRRRASLVRRAVTGAVVSIFLAAVLIVVLFFAALFRLEVAWLIAIVFVLCLAALIYSLASFLREINESLQVLDLEVRIER